MKNSLHVCKITRLLTLRRCYGYCTSVGAEVRAFALYCVFNKATVDRKYAQLNRKSAQIYSSVLLWSPNPKSESSGAAYNPSSISPQLLLFFSSFLLFFPIMSLFKHPPLPTRTIHFHKLQLVLRSVFPRPPANNLVKSLDTVTATLSSLLEFGQFGTRQATRLHRNYFSSQRNIDKDHDVRPSNCMTTLWDSTGSKTSSSRFFRTHCRQNR